jgi:hypothetical protein
VGKRLPPEAFGHYLSLGAARSYQAVATHFGVSKRAVTNRAARENWQAKLEESQQKLRARAEEHAQESLEAMTIRHLRILKIAQSKALEALRTAPIHSGTAAIRTVVLCVEKERAIRGEPLGKGQDDAREYAERVRQALAEMKERTFGSPTDP